MPPDLVAVHEEVEEDLAKPPPPHVAAVAQAARAQHDGIVAVLFYGSCRRDDRDPASIVDLYLLAESYAAAQPNPVMRLLNRLLPPNVYYIESTFAQRRVAAKYAIVSLDHFMRLVGPQTVHPYFWARFAQPTGLVWVRDEGTRARVVAALSQAIETAAGQTRPLLPKQTGPLDLWIRTFQETYRTELRSEPPTRANELVAADQERYERLGKLLLRELPVPNAAASRRAERLWTYRRAIGKALSVLRLAKAATTFTRGPDYLLWKIERHSGVRIKRSAWQRRHPFLSFPWVAWEVYRRGGFR